MPGPRASLPLPLRLRPALLAALVCLVAAVTAGCREPRPAPPSDTSSPAGLPAVRRLDVPVQGAPHGTVAYWGNVDVREPDGRTRAVIVIHGDQRNAGEYFAFARTAAVTAQSDALIIAPRFVTADDAGRARSDLTWSDDDWKSGATPDHRGGVSSFEVIDRLIAGLVADDPALTEVVVAGHSAGGQFVQRYAAAAHLPAGAHVRFVVANPSSYLYLDHRRPVDGAFDEPSRRAVRACDRYDDYKFGLDRLPAPLKAIGAATLRAQYRARDVTILLGALDLSDDDNLDRGCEAGLQGAQRYERGVLFYQYVQALFPPAGEHALRVVPGVGHDAAGMLDSEAGRLALFGPPGAQASRGP